ncbi:hypothetical protein BCR44DRAFT_1051116 [Catenaria anguillulae PL171]|uniref:Uncharacterized protein n=1 Tax=Catenaria anguillulae PL171 TaxID=765915 RepID=A0A1Y2HR81_9FUNG|nr:hypothetical protein BCR44DRAFT_1051116 [Catenaria anguillulae PL171]
MDILQGGFELTGMTRLRAAIRNDPTQVAADLAVLDVRALTCQLASGLQHEVASALNVLLVTSVVQEAAVPVDQSPQLVRTVAEVAIKSLEQALEMTERIGCGGEEEESGDADECDPIAYLLPMDQSVSESDRAKVLQLLETAVESLQVMRNWSFDHKQLISSLPRVLGVLARVVTICLPRIDHVVGTCGPWWSISNESGREHHARRLRPLGRSHAVVDALVTIVHQVVVIVSNVVLDLDMSKLPLSTPPTDADAENGRTPKRRAHLSIPTRSAFISSTMDLVLFWLLWTRSYLPRLNLALCTLANHPTALQLSPAVAITSPGTTTLPDGHPPTSTAPFIGPADAVNAEHLALHALAALLPRIDPATCDADLARNPVASTLLFARVGHLLPLRGFMDTAMIAIRGMVGLPVLLMPCLQCHPMPVVDIVLGLMQGWIGSRASRCPGSWPHSRSCCHCWRGPRPGLVGEARLVDQGRRPWLRYRRGERRRGWCRHYRQLYQRLRRPCRPMTCRLR